MKMVNIVVNGEIKQKEKHCTCSGGFLCHASDIVPLLFLAGNSLKWNCELCCV